MVKTMSKSSTPPPANIGGFKIEGATYAASTSRNASPIRGSPKSSNHKSTSCVTTGAPCNAAADNPTTMNRTLRRSRARRKRSSLALSEGAATGQTPAQPFERRLLQQNERVPNIVRVGLGPHRQHRADGLHQSCRPTAGIVLPRIFFLNAHAVLLSARSLPQLPPSRTAFS